MIVDEWFHFHLPFTSTIPLSCWTLLHIKLSFSQWVLGLRTGQGEKFGRALFFRWLPSASCSSVLAFLWWCMPEVTIVGCPSISPLVTFRFVVRITGIFCESIPLRCHSYHNGPVIIMIAVSSWFYFQGPLSPLPSAVPSSASATTSPGLQERARPELVSGAGALQPLTLEDGIFSETSLKHVLKFLALHLLGDF